MKKCILAYVPVFHQGYRIFFDKHVYSDSVEKIFVFGPELILKFDHFRKDIRALDPQDIKTVIQSLYPVPVELADLKTLDMIARVYSSVIMPDEEECHQLVSGNFDSSCLCFDPIFLRWDRKKILAKDQASYDRVVPCEGFFAEMMFLVDEESKKASNWWRQVGAIIARDKEILLKGFNCHVPSLMIQYTEGDPRSFFKRGLNIELTTDYHAEARLISEAARRGISLEGTDLYLRTFPCPPCAKHIAYSGIKKCFFSSGYTMLDGERVLRSQGVEIILVK